VGPSASSRSFKQFGPGWDLPDRRMPSKLINRPLGYLLTGGRLWRLRFNRVSRWRAAASSLTHKARRRDACLWGHQRGAHFGQVRARVRTSSPTVWPLVMGARRGPVLNHLGGETITAARNRHPATDRFAFSFKDPRHLVAPRATGASAIIVRPCQSTLRKLAKGPVYNRFRCLARCASALSVDRRAQHNAGGPLLQSDKPIACFLTCGPVFSPFPRPNAKPSKGVAVGFVLGCAPVKQEFRCENHGVILAGNPRSGGWPKQPRSRRSDMR